jgi:hypothetical protein
MTLDQRQIFDEFVREIDAITLGCLAELQTKIEDAFGDDKEMVELMMRRHRAKVTEIREQKLAQFEAKLEARRH